MNSLAGDRPHDAAPATGSEETLGHTLSGRAPATSSLRNELFSTSVWAGAGRVGGLVIPFVVAAFFGANEATDSFFFVYGIVVFVTLVAGHVFEAVLVPALHRAKEEGNLERTLGAVVARSLTLVASLAGVGALALVPFAWFLHWTPELARMLILSALLLPIPFLVVATSTWIGALNAERRFRIGAMSPIFRSLPTLVWIVAMHRALGIYAVATGFLLGELTRAAVVRWSFARAGLSIRWSWAPTPAVAEFFRSARWQLAGFCALGLVPLANHVAARWLPSGELSVLAYAVQLRNAPSLLLTVGVSAVVLTEWSQRYTNPSLGLRWATCRRVIGGLTLVGAATAGALWTGRDVLTGWTVGWGAVESAQLVSVSLVFGVLIAALPFDLLAVLCSRLLIVLRHDALYARLAAVKLFVLFVLLVALSPRFGVLGIAVATSVATAVHALLLYAISARRMRPRESWSYPTADLPHNMAASNAGAR